MTTRSNDTIDLTVKLPALKLLRCIELLISQIDSDLDMDEFVKLSNSIPDMANDLANYLEPIWPDTVEHIRKEIKRVEAG